MPDDEDSVPDTEDDEDDEDDGRVISGYGIGSAVLALLSVAAIALGVLIWHAHREDKNELAYLSRVMQTAADWAGLLINMNTANLDASLQKLHDGTVGDLNTEFDGVMQYFRQVVQKLQANSIGEIDAVAIDTAHRDLDTQPGRPRTVVTTKLPVLASRTDSVMVVATSISQKVDNKPVMVHWKLRLDVSKIEDKLMISKLETIK